MTTAVTFITAAPHGSTPGTRAYSNEKKTMQFYIIKIRKVIIVSSLKNLYPCTYAPACFKPHLDLISRQLSVLLASQRYQNLAELFSSYHHSSEIYAACCIDELSRGSILGSQILMTCCWVYRKKLASLGLSL